MKPRVIFTTTVFDDVQTGPGIYARYLWRAFRDDPDLEFHVVAPAAKEQHPRLHTLGPAAPDRRFSARMNRRALELAGGRQRDTIIHGNMAHVMGEFADYAGPWIAQVNDYEVATLWRHATGTLLRSGPRRLATLLCRRRWEKKLLPAATRVVCNSNATRRCVLEAYHLRPERVVTIYKAVDVSEFRRPSERPADPLPDRPTGTRLVFVGTNWPIKGLDALLRAFPAVAAKFPGVTLAVAGPVVTRRNARMVALAERMGLAGRVLFLGRVDRSALPALLWHSDVFVLPSRMEAFGVAVIEALAAGVPVVAARVGGIPEIVLDPDVGVLYNGQKSGILAQALVELLLDEPRRRRMAVAGPGRAADFSTARMIDGVKKLYLDVALERGMD